jgi:chromosomal replication initiator protein
MNRLSESVWSDILSYVRKHHHDVCPGSVGRLDAGVLNHGVLTVMVSDALLCEQLKSDAGRCFAEAAQAVTGHLVTVRFVLDGESESPAASDPAAYSSFASSLRLNPDYTFDHFVTGPENRLAHAACRAAAEAPGQAYNPLFVHGQSGLGKTHLLQAVCYRLMQDRPHMQVMYLTCEMFVNDYIEAVQRGRANEFRHRYREADLLLLDDIHFLRVGERSQDEFFHTFNTLFQSQRQIVLSADCAPSEIPDLAERLVSRFKWGLVVRIDPFSVETRIAILRAKARMKGIAISDDVLDFIGTVVKGNARDLEGALAQVRAAASLIGEPITLETARTAIGARSSAAPPLSIAIPDIISTVARFYNLKPSELRGKRRHQTVALARQACMYLARRLTSHSLEEIGDHLGGRDHSTVLHAQRVIQERRESNTVLDATLSEIESLLQGPPGGAKGREGLSGMSQEI